MAGLFTAGLGLAGLFYLALHYTTGARWDVALRRVAEALAGLAPAGSLLALGTGGLLVLVLHRSSPAPRRSPWATRTSPRASTTTGEAGRPSAGLPTRRGGAGSHPGG